jgi:hypothetical protein
MKLTEGKFDERNLGKNEGDGGRVKEGRGSSRRKKK